MKIAPIIISGLAAAIALHATTLPRRLSLRSEIVARMTPTAGPAADVQPSWCQHDCACFPPPAIE